MTEGVEALTETVRRAHSKAMIALVADDVHPYSNIAIREWEAELFAALSVLAARATAAEKALEQAQQALVDLHESLFVASEKGVTRATLASMASFSKDAALKACVLTPPEAVQAGGDPEECEHTWIDVRNAIVTSGEWCPKCNGIRAGNASAGGGAVQTGDAG